MPAVREPNLPAPHDAALRQLVQTLDETIYNITGKRYDGAQELAWAEPSTLFAVADRLVRQLAEIATSFRNGSNVRRGSEPAGWRGAAAAGSDAKLVARFCASHGRAAEPIVKAALAQHRDLMRRAHFGLTRISVEKYVASALALADIKAIDE